MPQYTTKDICNIALVGHSNAGKTTLIETLLHHAGVLSSPGKVENGNTVCDFDPMEKAYQHSLSASITHFNHQNTHINLIDTPGYPDLLGHALSIFPAVETVAIVINAQIGIETVTRRMMEQAAQRKQCRLLIINKIDAPDLNLQILLAEIKSAFGAECLPINLPAENATQVVDCFFNPSGEADFSSVDYAHTKLIDQVVEVDEKLMEIYLEQGEELTPEQLHAPFEKALREGHLVPICFTSAQTGTGIPQLLNIFAKLMPNPLEGNPQPFLKGQGDAVISFHAQPDPSLHAIAQVFKVTADPFIGKLGVFRIHQGTINKDTQLYIGEARKPFKVAHLFKLQGRQQLEIDQGIPGDICAVAKIDAIHLDAVLHDSHEEDKIHLKSLDLPLPMYGLAISPKRQGEEQKLSLTLQKLQGEDPCLTVEHDTALNQTVLRGLGEFHLRIVLEKMHKHYNVEVDTQPPKIPYKETISIPAEGHHRHKKQTGGAGQFGEVFLKIEPLPRGTGFQFVDATVGGSIPAVYIPAIQKGIQQVLEAGAIAGYRIQDIRATVYDGKYHSVDSKEIAFVSAGKKAFLDAIHKAKPLILEPIVKIEVTVPNQYIGAISGDLSSKRARIQGSDIRPPNLICLRAEVPLGELTHYQTQLKSSTGGQGSFNIQFSHYEPVPALLQQHLIAQYKPLETED